MMTIMKVLMSVLIVFVNGVVSFIGVHGEDWDVWGCVLLFILPS